ncbi:Uncharacterised protein [uncultured archaeon]|nr:Uncharacterised protein [uncultured archaeon]
MVEKDKSVSDGKLYIDDGMKSVLVKGGSDGRRARILIGAYHFTVYDPQLCGDDLIRSLELELQEIKMELERKARTSTTEQQTG